MNKILQFSWYCSLSLVPPRMHWSESLGNGVGARRRGFSQRSSGRVMAASSSPVCTCSERGGACLRWQGVQWGSVAQALGVIRFPSCISVPVPYVTSTLDSSRDTTAERHLLQRALSESLVLDITSGIAMLPLPELRFATRATAKGVLTPSFPCTVSPQS